MEYLVFVLSLWGIYAMQALLLDVLVGEMGLLALCQGVFFGCGAYGVVIVGSYPGSSLPLAAMAGIVISGLLAVTVGAVLSRLGGDDFALATYALALVFHDAVLHWTRATGGALGLVLPEQVWHRGDGLWANFAILAVIASLVGCAVWLSTRWRAAPLGRLVNAIREDETLTRSLGRPVERHRLAAMLATAIGGGVGGVCYALVVGVVDPGGFDPMASILLVAMIVIGGAGTALGPVVGAGLVIVIPEVLRLSGLSGSTAAHLKQMAFGVLLYLIVAFRPNGLFGRLAIGVERRS